MLFQVEDVVEHLPIVSLYLELQLLLTLRHLNEFLQAPTLKVLRE